MEGCNIVGNDNRSMVVFVISVPKVVNVYENRSMGLWFVISFGCYIWETGYSTSASLSSVKFIFVICVLTFWRKLIF